MITSLTSDFVDEKFTDWMLNVQEKYRYRSLNYKGKLQNVMNRLFSWQFPKYDYL